MPLVPGPFWKFPFFFFFLKDLERIVIIIFFLNMKICSLSKSEEDEDEDEDGVKVMKIYSWWFFFCEKPIRWMRITLARSWCELLDKSFSIPAKR